MYQREKERERKRETERERKREKERERDEQRERTKEAWASVYVTHVAACVRCAHLEGSDSLSGSQKHRLRKMRSQAQVSFRVTTERTVDAEVLVAEAYVNGQR